MSQVLTIPKKLMSRGDLVVIPRIEYEEYLNLKKIIPLVKLNRTEKKRIEQGREQIRNGQFLSLKELKHELAC